MYLPSRSSINKISVSHTYAEMEALIVITMERDISEMGHKSEGVEAVPGREHSSNAEINQ